MKVLLAASAIFFSATSHGGMLAVQTDDAGSTIGGEVRFFKLETQLGKPHLFLLDTTNQACRVPVALLKELGIDPVQLGTNLRNVRGNDGITLTCFVTKEQLGKRAFAHKIDISSWPRP